MFDEVGLSYKGKEYVVPPERVMGLIAEIEEHITHEQIIHSMSTIGDAVRLSGGSNKVEVLASIRIPRAKLAAAMGSAYRYAGAKVNDSELYQDLFGSEGVINVLAVLDMLLKMTCPPGHMAVKEAPKKKAPAKKAQASSSKRRTK